MKFITSYLFKLTVDCHSNRYQISFTSLLNLFIDPEVYSYRLLYNQILQPFRIAGA